MFLSFFSTSASVDSLFARQQKLNQKQEALKDAVHAAIQGRTAAISELAAEVQSLKRLQ